MCVRDLVLEVPRLRPLCCCVVSTRGRRTHALVLEFLVLMWLVLLVLLVLLVPLVLLLVPEFVRPPHHSEHVASTRSVRTFPSPAPVLVLHCGAGQGCEPPPLRLPGTAATARSTHRPLWPLSCWPVVGTKQEVGHTQQGPSPGWPSVYTPAGCITARHTGGSTEEVCCLLCSAVCR